MNKKRGSLAGISGFGLIFAILGFGNATQQRDPIIYPLKEEVTLQKRVHLLPTIDSQGRTSLSLANMTEKEFYLEEGGKGMFTDERIVNFLGGELVRNPHSIIRNSTYEIHVPEIIWTDGAEANFSVSCVENVIEAGTYSNETRVTRRDGTYQIIIKDIGLDGIVDRISFRKYDSRNNLLNETNYDYGTSGEEQRRISDETAEFIRQLSSKEKT